MQRSAQPARAAIRRHAALTALLGVLILPVGCNVETGKPSEIIVDGSSTVLPISTRAADEFNKLRKGRVTVSKSGTGGGFGKLVRNEIDICGASRPILASEMKLAQANGVEYIELAIAIDALTVIIHKDNDWARDMSVAELRQIWDAPREGFTPARRWREVRPDWPDEPIQLYGAGAASGTFDYFTLAINGREKQSRTDFNASEDDNTIVTGVAGDRLALGFLGYSYYIAHTDKLQAVAIRLQTDSPAVLPSQQTIDGGTYQPLMRPLFYYVRKSALEREDVRAFLTHILDNKEAIVSAAGYKAMPPSAIAKSRERLEKMIVGTSFGGHAKVGISPAALFDTPPSLEPRDE